MLALTSNSFKPGDRRLIRKFSNYVLRKFVRNGILKAAKINIKVLTADEISKREDADDLASYKAWCTYDGNDGVYKKFTVVLNANRIKQKGKTSKTRLSSLMVDLAHELVHVKQYLNGEMRDYVDGSYKFLGQKYKPIPDGDETEEYYDSPCEIEAYGREQGLYRMFWIKEGKSEK
jgi:hypothetical protein